MVLTYRPRVHGNVPLGEPVDRNYVNVIIHTHTVCVTYYKASPYNISHTKNIFTAKYNRVIYANTIILKLHMHIKKASISMNF